MLAKLLHINQLQVLCKMMVWEIMNGSVKLAVKPIEIN